MKYKGREKQYNREYKQKVKARRLELYGANECQHCGERRQYCLTFHHRDPETKKYNLSSSQCIPDDELVDELAKCDLLCHNCHAEVHHQLAKE